MAPKVSVVIPTYRDPNHTLEALASVRAQSETDWEAVVVDDGSGPDMQAALRRGIDGLRDSRIHFYPSSKNRGPARTRNLGIRLAKGRYLAFLDADDLWFPDKLAKQLAAMERAACGFSCTNYENFDVATDSRHLRRPPQRIDYDRLLYGNAIGCSTVVIDRQLVPRSYFPEIEMRQDFAHWLKILKQGHVALGVPLTLTQRRQFPTSLSSNKRLAVWHTWRMYRDIEGFGRVQAGRYFAGYLLRGIFKR